jgi:hypothetical protein
MNQEQKPFRSPVSAKNWISTALTGWFSGARADCYQPFTHFFSFRLNPSEILYSVYCSHDNDKRNGITRAQQRNLNKGLALLISDEATLLWGEVQFCELLAFAGEVGSSEALKALTVLVNSPALEKSPSRPMIAAQAFSSGWIGRNRLRRHNRTDMMNFLRASQKHVGNFGVSAPSLLVQFSRYDPNNWCQHLMSLKQALQEYAELRTDNKNLFSLVSGQLVEDLQRVLGKKRYRSQIESLKKEGKLDQLEWLVPKH